MLSIAIYPSNHLIFFPKSASLAKFSTLGNVILPIVKMRNLPVLTSHSASALTPNHHQALLFPKYHVFSISLLFLPMFMFMVQNTMIYHLVFDNILLKVVFAQLRPIIYRAARMIFLNYTTDTLAKNLNTLQWFIAFRKNPNFLEQKAFPNQKLHFFSHDCNISIWPLKPILRFSIFSLFCCCQTDAEDPEESVGLSTMAEPSNGNGLCLCETRKPHLFCIGERCEKERNCFCFLVQRYGTCLLNK